MNKSAFIFVICFLLWNCHEPEITRDTLTKQVDGIVDPYIIFGSKVSIVVGIINREEEIFLSYGEKDINHGGIPDEHTIYELASITKTFTGTLLAQLHIEGKVHLEDPAEQYLPTVSIPAYEGRKITLVDLATHTSSLPRLPDNFDTDTPIDENPYQDFSEKDMYSFLSNYTLPRAIGSGYEYSNLGMGLLGHVLGKADVTNYEQLVTKRILAPLNMHASFVSSQGHDLTGIAIGFAGKKPVPYWDTQDVFQGALSIKSNVKDMFGYLKANMGLQPSTLYDAMALSHQPRFSIDERSSIGLGWIITTRSGGEKIIWHNGATFGYNAFIGFNKETSQGIIILTNSGMVGGDATNIGFEILKVMHQQY